MFPINRQFFSWLLILAVAISPVRISLASDFAVDSHNTPMDCQDLQLQASIDLEQKIKKNCQSALDDHCIDHSHSGCVSESNSSPLQMFSHFLSVASAVAIMKFQAVNESVLSRYPELLKRPPIA